MAMFKNWLHRLHKLPLSDASKTKEFNTILNIAENNGYNRKQIARLDNSIKKKKKERRRTNTTTKRNRNG
jgi:hypothetical protein